MMDSTQGREILPLIELPNAKRGRKSWLLVQDDPDLRRIARRRVANGYKLEKDQNYA